MKIIVTGATGSLGGSLVRYFSRKGHEVIAAGRQEKPMPELKKYAEYIQRDIRRKMKLPRADACIHAAALSDDKATYRDLVKPNISGSYHTLKACKNAKTFIHISSSSVYVPSEQPIKEEDAGARRKMNLSPYGKTKLEAEAVVKAHAGQEQVFILRPRALYGIGDKMILPRMFKLLQKNKIFAPGGLSANASMTHYRNFNHAVELCLHSDKAGIHSYNVSDGKAYLLRYFISRIFEELQGEKPVIKHIPVGLLKPLSWLKIGGISPLLLRSLSMDMVLDTEKIKNELKYQALTDFETELPALIKRINDLGGIEQVKKGEKSAAWSGL